MTFREGQEVSCAAPFLKTSVSSGGHFWSHGINFDSEDGYSPIGSADGEGVAVFKIIKIVEMPKPFVDRILFMKRVVDPDGNKEKFGGLMMLGERGFKNLSTGGRWNYDIT